MEAPTVNQSLKHPDQHRRLLTLQLFAIIAGLSLLFAEPAINEASMAHEIIELAGLGLLMACVVGRLWCILYIGGKKNRELISMGPFSMSRNPLYFFSTVGAFGAGLVFGSILAAVVAGIATYMILNAAARSESNYLAASFGHEYHAYATRTPRFWPNPFRYRDEKQWLFSPPALRRNLFDGLYFLTLFPVFEMLEYLRESGLLPVMFKVY